MPHRIKETKRVPIAWTLFGRTLATSAPTPAATIVAAMGSNCSAVIRSKEVIYRCDILAENN